MRYISPRLFAVLLVSAGVLLTAEARADLTGKFAFVGVRTCIVSSTPFIDDASGAPTVISGAVFRQNAIDAGTFTFYADGTGMQTGRSSTLDLNNTTVGTSIYAISKFSVPFTYAVSGSTLDIKFGKGTFTVILGAGTGNTGTTSPREEKDQLAQSGDAFLGGPATEIQQETVNVTMSDGGSFMQYRLCTRSGDRVRLR
jgi:hypothetical protein